MFTYAAPGVIASSRHRPDVRPASIYEFYAHPVFAGAEHFLRVSQGHASIECERMRASKHAPGDLYRVLERRHCLAEMVKRGILERTGP